MKETREEAIPEVDPDPEEGLRPETGEDPGPETEEVEGGLDLGKEEDLPEEDRDREKDEDRGLCPEKEEGKEIIPIEEALLLIEEKGIEIETETETETENETDLLGMKEEEVLTEEVIGREKEKETETETESETLTGMSDLRSQVEGEAGQGVLPKKELQK